MNYLDCTTVLCRHADSYEDPRILSCVREAFAAFGFTPDLIRGKRVALKPNLVIKKGPETAATVHPALVDAVLTVLDEMEPADVVIGESCGGPFTEGVLSGVFRATGIADVAAKHRAHLNTDYTERDVPAPNGALCKGFHIIAPIAEAQIVINLSKLKSHTLTTMSGAVKNWFGTIPGTQKFEMHARFSDYSMFNAMLVDLCDMHHDAHRVLNLQDAVMTMEGNGPTGGSPRYIGCILASDNAFALDLLAEHLIGFDGTVPMINIAKERGFCPDSWEKLNLIGDDPAPRRVTDFVTPDSKTDPSLLVKLPKLLGSRAFHIVRPRPLIKKSVCVGCGECARSCPKHTITVEKNKKGKRYAKIHRSDCIHCFCCQELCPYRAIAIRQNPVLKLLG